MSIPVRTAALGVMALAAAVTGGYAFHVVAIIRVLPGLQGMSPLTAWGLSLLAVSILADDLERYRLEATTAAVALSVALVILISHAVFGSDRLSPVITSAVFHFDPAVAGKTSVATALCLAALAIAALTRARPLFADGAGAVGFLVSGMALIGYGYGVSDLYAVAIFKTMALHTALAIVLLSAASLMVRPEVGWASVISSQEAGGAATRRQLAFICLVPILGGLLLHGTNSHALGPGAAMASLVILTIAPLALIILRDGRILNTLEQERRQNRMDLTVRLDAQAAQLAEESRERVKAEATMFRAQRLDAVGQLTGGIAHDFNNLLMAIGGNLQLMRRHLPADHPARRYADNAALATDKGAKLTSQLLAFSRTQKMNVRPVELDPLLHQARQLLGNALGPLITVDLRLGAGGVWVRTDPDQLELAILNLAVNARDAMPEGGALIVASGPSGLEPTSHDDGAQFISICVTDTGEGMSEAVLDQAVEPFFTTKARGKGTGLGLAQVYGFVRQSGGDMHIRSQLGVGTTVELLLKRDIQGEAYPRGTAVSGPAPKAVAGEGRLVLVVDDDDVVRGVLVESLRTAGFRVVEASSGEEGLRRLDAERPVAAIIDFIMPGMNGVDVARRAQACFPDMPIIFVSGYFDTVALDGVMGAVVLRKPFDVEGLNRAVSSALQ